MTSLASAAMSLAMISVFLLAIGGIRLALQAQTRKRGALMLVAAGVLMLNVLIWTL